MNTPSGSYCRTVRAACTSMAERLGFGGEPRGSPARRSSPGVRQGGTGSRTLSDFEYRAACSATRDLIDLIGEEKVDVADVFLRRCVGDKRMREVQGRFSDRGNAVVEDAAGNDHVFFSRLR